MASSHPRWLGVGIFSPKGWLALSLFAASAAAFAAPDPVRIEREPGTPPLQALALDAAGSEVLGAAIAGKPRISVVLRGVYLRRNWTLTYEAEEVPRSGSGSFQVTVAMSRNPQAIQLQAVGPNGAIESAVYRIRVADWDGRVRQLAHLGAKSGFPSVGVSSTFLQYSDDSVSHYVESALTLRASYVYAPSQGPLHFDLDGDFTAATLTHTLPPAARFLNLNFRAGYNAPWLPEPWGLTLFVGAYYTTMFVSGNAFGYSNVYGPQLYPAFSRTFRNGDIATFYLKYSPISDRLSLISLSSREVAAGLAYTWPLADERTLSVKLDASDLRLQLEQSSQERLGRMTSISLGVGYGY